jgi:hypothetical protein
MSAIGKNGGGKAKVVDAVLPNVGKKVRLSDTASADAAKKKSNDDEQFAKYMRDAQLKWTAWSARAKNRFVHLRDLHKWHRPSADEDLDEYRKRTGRRGLR